jgi:hypothetical protein
VIAHPTKEPFDDSESDKEGDDKTDEENDPAMRGHDQRDHRLSGNGSVLGVKGAEEFVAGAGDHDGDGKQEAELQGRRSSHAYDLAAGDGGHRARGAWKDGRGYLAETNPDSLPCGHFFDFIGGRVGAATPGVDDPHDNSADEEGEAHDVEAFKMLADDLDKQQ